MRLTLIAVLVLVLAACAPTFTPATEPLPDVVLTATATDDGMLYRVDAAEPATIYLRWVGVDLDANAEECTVTPSAVACAVGEVQSFYSIVLAGVVDPALRTFGYACRDTCHPLFLTN